MLVRIASDLGYPQPPTLLRMGNTVAIALAQGTINAKRSKSMDMRFFWISSDLFWPIFIVWNHLCYLTSMEGLKDLRGKKMKMYLMATLLLCTNTLPLQMRQHKRRHRVRNKILQRENGLKWMAGAVLQHTKY
jgi:hypothetical protein